MSKPSPTLVFVAVLLLASLACSSGGVATPDPGLINTMVAQTLSAIQIQSAVPGIPATSTGTVTALPTSTPESPTPSPTITLTLAPVFTATPSVPLISVSVPTNCRVGPGRAYDRVGALLAGEVAEVFGRDLGGNYWYIRNPDNSSGFCWLWGEYATLAGNTQALPVFTPPPTPTPAPAFVADYSGLEACAGTGWWVEVRLENTGGRHLQVDPPGGGGYHHQYHRFPERQQVHQRQRMQFVRFAEYADTGRKNDREFARLQL